MLSTRSNRPLPGEFLVESQWLAEKISAGIHNVVVADVRGYVRTVTSDSGEQIAEYIGAHAEYTESHIPGAVYIDWTRDIVDINNPIPAQVASVDQISALFGGMGIGNDTLIVAYDSHPA